jgi:NarL family two-component system sensor histidine kinase YdfH
MGLYLALIGQVAGTLWPDLRAIALAVSFYILLLVLNIIDIWSAQALLEILPIMGIMLVFVLVYVTLFVRQVQAREQSQKLLQELELAHGQLQEYAVQVEELTLSQERQRMARELHDTLAQGLAGLILQLEAADSHLESDNAARAQHVVQQAMGRARTTLHEARLAIQALRSPALEHDNLIDALGHEVDQFAATTGLRTTFEVNVETAGVPPAMAQNILRIVQESLSNAARHAQASHVLVRLEEDDGRLQVVVQDDGAGFDPAQALEQPGCFGLAGMKERAEQLGGQLEIESTPGRGTRVVLSMGGEEG